VHLGTYQDPPAVEAAPVERVAEEGVLVAASAVRMAVKNHLIVRALQHRTAFDREALAEAAASEFVSLAIQSEDSARRVWTDGDWDDEPSDGTENLRRRTLFLAVAAALRVAADDRESIDAIVESARDDALAEIGAALTVEPTQPEIEVDADYERERQARIRAFKEVDLATLGELQRYRDLLN
jgi:hypothetical protein